MARVGYGLGHEAMRRQAGRVVLTDDEQRRDAQRAQAWLQRAEALSPGQARPQREREAVSAVGHQARADETLGPGAARRIARDGGGLAQQIDEGLDAVSLEDVRPLPDR